MKATKILCAHRQRPPPPSLLSPPLLSPTMTSSSAPSRKALSKIACNRLQKELAEWQVNPPVGFKHKVTDNLQRWVIEVNGAPGTLYADEKFQLQCLNPVSSLIRLSNLGLYNHLQLLNGHGKKDFKLSLEEQGPHAKHLIDTARVMT
ncbi:hypothetical protein RJ639_041838 [Escallonia herrerae]|uniref:UBC core domain-containing protein n=1 Tax=Escallonia herrerae TaxID=1293975 RepID=A0AA88WEX3_9ASTE|nr:hypothetical protein RJ639_041838 [Escallonia herrerae]